MDVIVSVIRLVFISPCGISTSISKSYTDSLMSEMGMGSHATSCRARKARTGHNTDTITVHSYQMYRCGGGC